MNALTQRQALGQLASIGTLYTSQTDSFLPQSLLKPSLTPSAIFNLPSAPGEQVHVDLRYGDSYEEKFDLLGIEPSLRGSILGGLVSPSGVGRYLDEVRVGVDDNTGLHAAMHRRLVKCEEKLNFMNSDLAGFLASTTLQSQEATHVVTGIKWGVQSVVMTRAAVPRNADRGVVEADFRQDMEAFKAALLQEVDSNAYGKSKAKLLSKLRLEVTAYSDILLDDGIAMANLQEGFNFLDLMPLEVRNINNGMGYPISYSLLPVSMLPLFLPIQISNTVASGSVSEECLKRFTQLFDAFRAVKQELFGYQILVAKQARYLPPNHVKELQRSVQGIKIVEGTLKSKFGKSLQEVRAGAADADVLWQMLREYSSGDRSPTNFASITGEQGEKVHFIEHAVSNGAVYIGYNGLDLRAELSRKGIINSYVLRFSRAAMEDKSSWKGNFDLFQQLLQDRQKGALLVIVDCDATSTVLEKAQILQFHNGQQITSDLLEQRAFLADKCLARYQKVKIDTSKDAKKKPLRRRFAKIPCPGGECDPTVSCDWLCSQCLAPLEYGYSDDFLYCDCGRVFYKYYDFKCKHDNHGPGYESYNAPQLLEQLKKLKQSNYLNILILGETGVGKSTFINAFVNYLTFETLDQAMKEEKLTWVIPCSFDAMDMDRKKPGSEIKRTKISVGSRPTEVDGSRGASATQQTTVYPVTMGTATVRLIDTPGIGDTRGLEYDRTNMADIITTLGSYDELHGVLILLKSNSARLTPSFSFCLKELLRNLHRDAARNMVFGFTNTRISNYTPGDTLGPLEALLEEHPDVGLSTSIDTMYCFDSESFRYLAAYKNGFIMANEEDFRRSWVHSKDETYRLLAHIQGRKPHMIKSTTSLHGTRELISMLAIPMADISQTIRTNIDLCEDHVKELKETHAKGEELRKKLLVEKIYLDLVELKHHRTVCRDSDCFELRQNDDGDKYFIYRKPCHDHCYLDTIIPDRFDQPELTNCVAFGGKHTCNVCGHPWEKHMHVIKETIEKKVTVNDGGVEKKLADHADAVVAKEQTIQDLRQRVEEYRDEHDQIQKAAAQFSHFLRREAIALYNDKTQKYIEYLINEEELKVHAGKKVKKLRDLQEDLKNYMEEVAILKKNVGTSANYPALTTSDIDRLVKHLYQLKHFGANLEALKKKNVKIYEAQNREVNHRVRGNTSWGWNTVSNAWNGGATYLIPSHQAPVQIQSSRYSIAKTSKALRHGPLVQNFHGSSIDPTQRQYQGQSSNTYGDGVQRYQSGSAEARQQQYQASLTDPYQQQYQTNPESPPPLSSDYSSNGNSSGAGASSRKVMGFPFSSLRQWGKR